MSAFIILIKNMARKTSIFISEEQKQNIIKAYTTDNLTTTEICRMGLFPGNRTTLTERLKQWGISIKNRETRLNDNLEEIIELWKSGVSLCKLGKQFKIKKITISNKLKELGYEVINPQLELQFDENIFDSIDTEEKAYWLGFIWADGNIRTVHSKDNKSEYGFTITLKQSDDKHLLKFNNFMKHKKDNRHYLHTKNPSCSWYVVNQHLWETLNNYGCTPRKSLMLEFPDESIFTDESLIRHFIRGYFDGDGCFSQEKIKSGIYPRLSLLGTLNFVNKVKEICGNIGSISEKIRKNKYYQLRFNRVESISFMNYIYSDCQIYLDRKYEKYKLFKKYPLLSYEDYEKYRLIFEDYTK